jgi:DNA-binding CsgD family transcriptional regulator
MHSRNDARVPFEEGRQLAATIPSARFIPLDSRNHVLLPDEPAWKQFLDEFRTFLKDADSDTSALGEAGLTASERAVLIWIARGLENSASAASRGKSEKTVRNQVSSIFAKLGIGTRSQAIVLAREAGIGGS